MSPTLSADAGAVARFALEARAVNAIGHPNIVDVFSFGRLPDGRSYFVMEWLQGETLYERLWKQHGPLPLTDVINVLDQICDALEATHDKGIIHRDLKPANVFLCPVRGRRELVKLLDFGVAKLAHIESSPRWTSRRLRRRHARVHLARAGARQGRRRAHRSLLARRHGLRDGARAAAVHQRQPGRRHPDAPVRDAAAAEHLVEADSAAARDAAA